MDDPLDPELREVEEIDDELDTDPTLGSDKKKPKRAEDEDEDIEALAEIEDVDEPYDDVDLL